MRLGGFIDYASLTEVANALRHCHLNEAYSWASQSAFEVTCALIHGSHFQLAPDTSGRSLSAVGPSERLIAKVREFVNTAQLDHGFTKGRLHNTRAWALRNVPKMRATLAALEQNEKAKIGAYIEGYNDWVRNALGDNLAVTVHRLGGLSDAAFGLPIARVLGIAEADLKMVLSDLTKIATACENILDAAVSEDLKRLCQRAFTVSIFLRGRLHDSIAKDLNLQIIHHRSRRPILAPCPKANTLVVPFSNVEQYVALITLAGSFNEVSHLDRVDLWAENVRRLRR